MRLPLLVLILAGCAPCGRDALRGSDGLCYDLVGGDAPRDTDADADTDADGDADADADADADSDADADADSDADTDADAGFTRFVHLVLDLPPLDVKVAVYDSNMVEDIPTGTQMGFGTPMGPNQTLDLEIHDDGQLVRALTVDIVSGQDSTIWIFPDSNSDVANVAQWPDDHTEVSGGRVRFRLIHAAPSLEDVAVYGTIDGLTFGPVVQNTASAYGEIHKGSFDFFLEAGERGWVCPTNLTGSIFVDDSMPPVVDGVVVPGPDGPELLLYVHRYSFFEGLLPLRVPCEPVDSGG